MSIVKGLIENTLNFVDRITDCVAQIPSDETREESADQKVWNGQDVQQALEDFRRFERVMSRRT
jgi:hypothetical protein